MATRTSPTTAPTAPTSNPAAPARTSATTSPPGTRPATTRPATTRPATTRPRDLLLVLAGATSSQTGTAVGSHAFAAIGPVGVVALRQVVASAVMLPLTRPDVRALTRGQVLRVLLLAATVIGMNLALYSAVQRVGLGLAVTLEFLGPLALALLGSRRPLDLATAAAAALGVYVLVLPGPSSDLPGIALGLLAGICWAGYILASRSVGAALPGAQGTALAMAATSVVYLPVVLWLVVTGRLTGDALAVAVVAGVLSSVVPYTLDLLVLRRVTAPAFGVVMSAHPVIAALVGVVALGQVLAAHEWVGIVVIVAANAVTVAAPRAGAALP